MVLGGDNNDGRWEGADQMAMGGGSTHDDGQGHTNGDWWGSKDSDGRDSIDGTRGGSNDGDRGATLIATALMAEEGHGRGEH